MSEEHRRVRLPSLTGLRFLLALAVLQCHAIGIFTNGTPLSRSQVLTVAGPVAVSGFFVLSGFVLTWAHRPGDRARAFWRRRFWKIVPNHALGWALAVGFLSVAPIAAFAIYDTGPVAGAISLFLLQTWIPRSQVLFAYNFPAWSISCEAFFYAVFPALIAVVRKVPRDRLKYVWAALATAIVALPQLSGPIGDLAGNEEYSLWFGYLLPPVRLVEFTLGIVTACMVQTGSWPRMPQTLALVPLITTYAAIPLLPVQFSYGTICAIPFALLIAALALADHDNRPTHLRSPALTALGDASYALYCVHLPLMLIGRSLIGTGHIFAPWTGILIAAGFMLIIQAIALLTYRRYEKPLMRRWSRPPTATTRARRVSPDPEQSPQGP